MYMLVIVQYLPVVGPAHQFQSQVFPIKRKNILYTFYWSNKRLKTIGCHEIPNLTVLSTILLTQYKHVYRICISLSLSLFLSLSYSLSFLLSLFLPLALSYPLCHFGAVVYIIDLPFVSLSHFPSWG